MALVLGGDDGTAVDDEVAHANLTVNVLQADAGVAEATGAVLRPAGGETLLHGLAARREDHGSTSFDTSLEVRCPTAGIWSSQDVLYRID